MTQLFKHSLQEILKFKYRIHTLIAFAIVAGVLIGLYAFENVRNARQARAQRAFAESYAIYEQALSQDKTMPGLWEEAEMAFGAGYQAYQNSTLAPYFLAFKADALIHQGKLSDALDIMNQALLAIPLLSPWYGSFAVKRALLKIDMQDAAMIQEGMTELQNLAYDTNNNAQDEAIYYAGLISLDSR